MKKWICHFKIVRNGDDYLVLSQGIERDLSDLELETVVAYLRSRLKGDCVQLELTIYEEV